MEAKPEMKIDLEIQQFIDEIVRDYKRKRVIKGLVLGFLSGFLLIFMTYFLRIYITFQINTLMIVILMIFPIIAGVILAVFLPIQVKELIAEVDKKVEFEEMLLTYYEYLERKVDNPYLQLLKKRLTSNIEKVDITGVFNLNLHREVRILAIILVSFMFFTIWIDLSGIYQAGTSENILTYDLNEDDSFLEYQREGSSNNSLEQPGQSEEEFRRQSPQTTESSFDFQPENLSDVEVAEEFSWDELEMESGESTMIEGLDEYSAQDSENSDSESSPGEGDYEDMSEDAQEQEGQEESESNRRQREEGEEDNSERDGDRSQSEEESEGSERTGQGERSRSVDRSDQTQEDTDDPETEGSALSEEPGTGTGEANQDDFQSLDEEYEGSRLKSQNSNYYNNYIEEFMRPDVEGGETGLPSEEMTNYRDFIINSLEDERIPANYREMVREYFNNIIEE